MASTIVFVLVVVLGATFSLPISSDGETVQSTKSLSQSDVTERTHVLDIETIRNLEEEIQPVPTFKTEMVLEADHVKRFKRGFVNNGELASCSGDMKEYLGNCLTPEQYADQAGDEYDEKI